MVRRASVGALLIALCVLALDAAPPAAPVRLARHPDYHAGKVAFSYLGDIWTRQRGRHRRPADHRQSRARDLSALLARRQVDRLLLESLRQQRRLRRAGDGRRAAAADVPHRATTKSSAGRAIRRASSSGRRVATAHFRASLRSIRSPSNGGLEKPLPVDWGYSGNYSPDGKSLVFNRHPAVWSRQHYRGSYAADLWIADLANKTYNQAARRRTLQPLLADVGRRRCDLLRRRPAAERQDGQAGQRRGPQERQQHLQDSGQGRTSPSRSRSTPTATCSGRRCRATAR